MISEIYASGKNGTSRFIIVESGSVIHRGSYTWKDTISFEKVSANASDLNCEVIAVICAIMLCRNDNRTVLNIYTSHDETQEQFDRRCSESPFFDSLLRHSDGMNILVGKWPTKFYRESDRTYYNNPYIKEIETLKRQQL